MTENKKPCKECPFRRTSVEGYLGNASFDPQAFIGPHWHGSAHLPCHMKVDYEVRSGTDDLSDVETCRGFAIFAKNSCKSLMNPQDEAARRAAVKDTEMIFNWMSEFEKHHNGENP